MISLDEYKIYIDRFTYSQKELDILYGVNKEANRNSLNKLLDKTIELGDACNTAKLLNSFSTPRMDH
jgi:hypothetical protein